VKGLKSWWWAIGAVVIAAVLFVVLRDSNGRAGSPCPPDVVGDDHRASRQIPAVAERRALPETPAAAEAESVEEPEEPMTAEERAEAEEEKLVDAFDELTDKWQEPSAKGVTMDDVNAFVKQFATVPKDRKEECLQRALNLIPDENVMLLLGVLMDKTQDKELVELVFNDILNRDEDVKQPILQQIFKDKTHPCWADTAWILDVTGGASQP